MRVDANRAVEFASASEEVPERMMEFDRLRVQLDHLNEGIDRLVVLVVQQPIQAAKIRTWQRRVIGRARLRLKPPTEPARCEHQRQHHEVPEFELHYGRSPLPTSATAPDCLAALAIRSAVDSPP